ncbi:MAG TPA: Hpt domain-containing protein [Chitinophagaceae bacterium]|nr:Hpt domain-containing protein [Chitinophagaceae bacterium]
MGSETLPKQFIFNAKMDKEALYSLYTDDYAYIEEIFGTVLEHYDADFSAVQLAFEHENLEDLKKAVHKMKPVFGYTGLLECQQHCKLFEDQCATATSFTSITEPYTYIKNELLEARDIIQDEYTRLKAFNANPL